MTISKHPTRFFTPVSRYQPIPLLITRRVLSSKDESPTILMSAQHQNDALVVPLGPVFSFFTLTIHKKDWQHGGSQGVGQGEGGELN